MIPSPAAAGRAASVAGIAVAVSPPGAGQSGWKVGGSSTSRPRKRGMPRSASIFRTSGGPSTRLSSSLTKSLNGLPARRGRWTGWRS